MSKYINADIFLKENEGAENSGWTLKELIDNFPSADVRENVRGEWIDTGSGQECSVCKEIQYGYDNYRNFCPNCGADMQNEVEE